MSYKRRELVRQSIPDALVNDIRERILSGEFEEGDQIRQELIAEEYGVSRMPVREALRRLEAEGLVVFHTHKGATVTKPSLAEISEMFDLRTLLETDALKHAIPAMTADHIRYSEKILEDLEKAYQDDDVQSWGALNTEFHLSLYDAAGRGLTKQFIQKVNYQTDRYVRLELILSGSVSVAEQEHRELIEFCKKGDVEAAVNLLEQHIQGAKKKLLAAVDEYRSYKLHS